MFKNGWKKKLTDYTSRKKKFFIGLAVILAVIFVLNLPLKKSKGSTNGAKTVSATIDRSFDFASLDNQGKATKNKVKFKITNIEKTNQVLVKDQVFTAKNNKLFLIINLELRNDATSPVNLMPGDLVRLSVGSDKDTRFAPDLHNNLVPISAISTKTDRVGFVIPDNAKSFILYIGEIEGEKQEVNLNFAS